MSTLHPVMMDVYGWSAWFTDDDGGRHDVRTYRHSVSDYLTAAIGAGFEVERCSEPRIGDEAASRIASSDAAPTACRVGVSGAPIALVWKFRRR